MTYLVVEILCPPFGNEFLFQLSADWVSHWNVSQSQGNTNLANFILTNKTPSLQTGLNLGVTALIRT
jgi:hypothetical protein